MKKLMIALAAVAMAAGVQAAQIDWKCTYTAAADLTGAQAYTFNATDRTAVLALLGDFTTASAVTAYALKFDGSVNMLTGTAQDKGGGQYQNSFTGGHAEGLTGTDKVFAIIFNDSIREGATYYASTDTSVADYIYEKGSGSPQTLNFKTSGFTTTGTITGSPSPVPEPTSGLLLLLGVAGLALKRRRV